MTVEPFSGALTAKAALQLAGSALSTTNSAAQLSGSVLSRLKQRRTISDAEARIVEIWADGVCKAYQDQVNTRLNDSKSVAIVQCWDTYFTHSARMPAAATDLARQRDRSILQILTN